MELYAIRRRNAWGSGEELHETAKRSTAEGEKRSDAVRWIRTYVVQEPDATLGSICIYEAVSPEAIREHASAVGMPADEVLEVVDTVVVRPDPVPEGAEAV